MAKFITTLEEGKTYHIYSRAIGSEFLFIQDGDYRYFWNNFKTYLSKWVDLHAYCLLPNHLHLLLSIKETPGRYLEEENKAGRSKIIQKFANCWNAYTKASNFVRERKGALFMRPFNRIEVDHPEYFQQLFHYIHQNPIKHGYCENLLDWPYSSYLLYLKEDYSTLSVHKVFNLIRTKKDILATEPIKFTQQDIMASFCLE